MLKLSINLHNTLFDKEYGRLDIAPRIMGVGEYDGEFGYLLAFDPNDKRYLVELDDSDKSWLRESDFVVISNITLVK